MLVALLAAVGVLGLGVWVMGRFVPGDGEVPPGVPRPAVPEPGAPVGGYTLVRAADGGDAAEADVPVPARTVARVRELLALGREIEAVRVLRDAAGMDERRARETVDRLRDPRRP
ncbi:Ribosomal protein L7/L12 C-terminal domain-containing protein [Nocardiopsis rhodophaea]